jgi:type I restriction enzyme S subunit
MVNAKLGSLGELKNGLNFEKTAVIHPCKIIGVADFQDYVVPDYDNLKTIDESLVADEFLLKENDILFVRSNGNKDLVGRIMIIKGIKEPVTFSGFCIRLRPDQSLVDPNYLFYSLKSPFCKKQYSHSLQTNITNLSQDILSNVNIPIIDLPSQKQNAELLNVLDKKIIGNRRLSKKLMELGQTIFDQCFYKLFDAKTNSKTIGDYVDAFVGKQYAGFATPNGTYRYFTCSRDSLWCDTPEFSGKAIIVATHGDFHAESYEGKFNAYFCNSILKPKDDTMFGLLYFFLVKQLPVLQQKSSGTVIKFIGNDEILSLPFYEPTDRNIYLFFNAVVKERQKLEEEAIKLERMRDFLLPIFMNGQAALTTGQVHPGQHN